jgi:Flp pilus assembly protein TadG
VCQRGAAADRGSVTVEAAVGLAVLALVLGVCLAGLACVLTQLRCADAAREAARLAARGDRAAAESAARALGPDGAAISFVELAGLITVTVSSDPVGGLLPGVTIDARASAAREDVQRP